MVTLNHYSGLTAAVRVLEVSSISLTSESRAITHALLGDPSPAITLRPPAPRTGRLVYVLATKADGVACETVHRTLGRITVDDPGVFRLAYVVTGPVRLYLDPRARRSWVLEVDVTEVSE